jgi:N-acetyl-beta-hexosaminidase
MRSDIVFEALQSKNRFVLCHEAFKAVRLLHKSNTRIEDTTNDALMRIADAERILVNPEDVATPPLEP